MSLVDYSSNLMALVRERIEQWHSHGNPDAAGVLAEHPELHDAKSLVMDLVLAEYSLRTAAGNAVEKSTFALRFPKHRQSIVRMLEVQEYLDRCPQFAEADEPVRWPGPGDSFLGYEIVEPLGAGGLARVFLAREGAVGDRHVVIKVSPLGGSEAQTLGKLSHPGIVPIHSVRHDDVDGWTVICMPLVGVATGIDLIDAAFAHDLLRRDGALVARVACETRPLTRVPLPAETAEFRRYSSYSEAICRIGLELAEALSQAHAAGILHRDIKPSNILLAWSGRAMLLDFNLSTWAGLATERIGGTLAYMAPEAMASLVTDRGEKALEFDPRCDIYSLGVVLYELLSGRLPFKPEGADRQALEACEPWLECKRLPVAALTGSGGEVEARLEAMVLKCLAFERGGRYATAAELADDLRGYLSGGARAQRFVKRNRRAVVLGAVAALVGSVGLGAFVGTRPTRLESVYQAGLLQYADGKFEAAADSFTQCLELRRGWPQALFGRGQALRKMGKWKEARIDFTGLAELEPAWAHALAGFCNMRLNDFTAAGFDFMRAHRQNLRDQGFLMNYAYSQFKRGRYFDAAEIYTQVIDVAPGHKGAIRERALAALAMTINSSTKIPCQQAFDDAEMYCRLEETFEGAYVASRIYANAAKKDRVFEEQAIRFLTDAIQRGLPKDLLDKLHPDLMRLLTRVDPAVLLGAQERAPGFQLQRAQICEPPDVADWRSFQGQFGSRAGLVAQNK